MHCSEKSIHAELQCVEISIKQLLYNQLHHSNIFNDLTLYRPLQSSRESVYLKQIFVSQREMDLFKRVAGLNSLAWRTWLTECTLICLSQKKTG